MLRVSDVAARDLLVGRYRVPQPRVALAEIVRDHASAAMDVSDGLAGDLTKLCGVSGVSAVIDLESIPLSDTARDLLSRGIVGIETLIAGGDDYEILCTVAEDRVDAFVQAAQRAGVAVSSIGTVVAGSARAKIPRRAGRRNRAETALLQPFLSAAALPAGLYLPTGHCNFPGNL